MKLKLYFRGHVLQGVLTHSKLYCSNIMVDTYLLKPACE